MKVNWEKCAWWGVLCVLACLLVAIYRQSLERSERIKQQDQRITSLREQLRVQEGRYRELQRRIRSYRQVPENMNPSNTIETRPAELDADDETDHETEEKGEPNEGDENPGQVSHWLLDVDDATVHSLVAELSEYADQLSDSEWMVVQSAKKMIHEELLERVSDEQKQAIVELGDDPYFSRWMDELVELTALDQLRMNED